MYIYKLRAQCTSYLQTFMVPIAGGFETPLSQFSVDATDDSDLKEACSSILSLPAGYITGASNEATTRRMSVPDTSLAQCEQGKA